MMNMVYQYWKRVHSDCNIDLTQRDEAKIIPIVEKNTQNILKPIKKTY